MTVLVSATIGFLTGLPGGIIVGLILAWVLFIKPHREAAEPDYSGGM